MAANPGGAPGNFLAALNAYGRKTAFLGKVGNDAFGNLLLGTLNAAGIETRGIRVDDSVFTTLAFVTFDESGDRAFSFARKPGADTQLRWDEVDKSLIDEAKVFHFGTLSLTDEPVRTATQKAVAYAKVQGKLISCDPNLRLPLWPDGDAAKAQMLWSLHQADVLEYYLKNVPDVLDVTVYDRTQDAVVRYKGSRSAVVAALAAFAFARAEAMDLVPDHTSRALNREFEEKLTIAAGPFPSSSCPCR